MRRTPSAELGEKRIEDDEIFFRFGGSWNTRPELLSKRPAT